MATSVNVFRYSALAFGIFYGITHQASLKSAAKTAQINHEYQHKSDLISKAKAEYLKKTLPQEKKTASGGVITDPQDPNFDLEAYLTMAQAGEA